METVAKRKSRIEYGRWRVMRIGRHSVILNGVVRVGLMEGELEPTVKRGRL